jgi:hypothetical protein
MRRRLISRCKGLLESSPVTYHGQTDNKLENSTVNYLHRTVRDYMQKADNWKQVVSSSESYYEPNLYLSVSSLMQMKTAETRADEEFWDTVFDCLDYAALSTASPIEGTTATAIKILDSLDAAAGRIAYPSAPGYVSPQLGHWTDIYCTKRFSLQPSDFFVLAVQCQLEWYVRSKLAGGYLQERNPKAWHPLTCAVRSKSPFENRGLSEQRALLRHTKPSLAIIEMLLESGFDSNATFNGYSAWKQVIQANKCEIYDKELWMDIAKAFLKHGANVHEEGAQELIRQFLKEVTEKSYKPATFKHGFKKAFKKFS